MFVEQINLPLKAITPHTVVKPTKKSVSNIAKDLEQKMPYPMLLDKNYKIIYGNALYEAFKKINYEGLIPVVVAHLPEGSASEMRENDKW